jgi:hypothetical protein
MALRKREREKKWDGKMNVSQICSSHMLKTIKSGKEFQENKLLEFFIACLLLSINYELFAFKFHLKKVKFRTSRQRTLKIMKILKTYLFSLLTDSELLAYSFRK